MLKEFPEVEDFLRMNGDGPTVIEYNNQTFTEEHLIEADSSFFNFFSIPVIKGDQKIFLMLLIKLYFRNQQQKKFSEMKIRLTNR